MLPMFLDMGSQSFKSFVITVSTLFRNIKDIKLEELIDWFVNVKKISIGGADIMDYLKYKEEVKEDGTIA